jgi:hypothetical protein
MSLLTTISTSEKATQKSMTSPRRTVYHTSFLWDGTSSRRTRPASTTRAIRKAPILQVPSIERMLKPQKDHLGGKEK